VNHRLRLRRGILDISRRRVAKDPYPERTLADRSHSLIRRTHLAADEECIHGFAARHTSQHQGQGTGITRISTLTGVSLRGMFAMYSATLVAGVASGFCGFGCPVLVGGEGEGRCEKAVWICGCLRVWGMG
jgi:hypothetical protein